VGAPSRSKQVQPSEKGPGALAAGVAWNFGMIYDKGLFRGKKAMPAVTTGGPKELYK
jgi:putative NADPH-quinone reductase